MKTPRALVFAIICGLIAMALSYYYLSRRDEVWEQKYGEVSVLVAQVDIDRYQIIQPAMIGLKKIPRAYTEPDVIAEKDLNAVVNMVAETTIRAGSQITLTKVASPADTLFSISIPKDSRACTISVNEITGVAGLIRPGDHVDIIGTFKAVDEKSRVANQVEAVTLFQNVAVLAAGRNYMFESVGAPGKGEKGFIGGGGGSGSSNLTLAMTPRECMDLTVSQQVGVLTLTLRSYLNRFGGKTLDELKTQHSTSASATGVKAPLEISKSPKWLEIRGEHTMMVP